VTANDPVVMLSAAAMVLGVGLLACIVPALKTTTIDPVRLLA
jgi:ABC-type antimicrobial peptide transport system permease subunit